MTNIASLLIKLFIIIAVSVSIIAVIYIWILPTFLHGYKTYSFFVIGVIGSAILGGYAKSESAEEFIRRLYNDHLTQYVKNEYWFDDKQILNKYFDSNLTKLFLLDEKCKEETGDVCNLDFDPIIDAQDYDEKYPTEIVIREEAREKNRYKVEFTNLGKRIIFYDLQKTDKGWRITDINYPNGYSLKKGLSRK